MVLCCGDMCGLYYFVPHCDSVVVSGGFGDCELSLDDDYEALPEFVLPVLR